MASNRTLFLALLLAGTSSLATAQAPDTSRALFGRRDAVLITLFTLASIGTSTLDSRIAHRIMRSDVQGRPVFENTANAFNFVNEKSLFLAGVAGYGISRLAAGVDAPPTDISLHVAEAVLVSTVFNTMIRGTLGRSRPMITNGDDPYDFNFLKGFKGGVGFDYRAFPSVHASAAFATAAVLTGEARRRAPRAAPWVGVATYGLATMPGLARMYKNKHWASDIVMGAFVGTLTGLKVVKHEHRGRRTWAGRVFLGR